MGDIQKAISSSARITENNNKTKLNAYHDNDGQIKLRITQSKEGSRKNENKQNKVENH